jgi:hypothetical protein
MMATYLRRTTVVGTLLLALVVVGLWAVSTAHTRSHTFTASNHVSPPGDIGWG